jgi:hypothetical protein
LALKRFAHEFNRSSVISLPGVAVNTKVVLEGEVGRIVIDDGEVTGIMVVGGIKHII